ncbi:hypothetical protein J1N35_008083 [Gossypium stocksii]|uniref:Uncharacterized protein n=1 Tax=Gossypium stocksii TaxID=47602 RepID=A0A9D4AG58_9ROSI|nr:hypothetical protein J1N35_008083 [Gossypium stocksii]
MDLSNEPTLSWKDKLVGKGQPDPKKTVEFLYSKDKNEEISANGGEKSKDFISKGKELIVNSDLGVLINDNKVVDEISRELGSKVAQVGYVKMVGLPGSMVSGSLVDSSGDPGWTRASSSKGSSKVIVLKVGQTKL